MSWLRIHHHSTYRYGAPVAGVWQTLRLQPQADEGQQCREFHLSIRPEPREISVHVDAFGNTVHHFSQSEPHTELHIETESIVRRNVSALPDAANCPTVAACLPALIAEIADGAFGLEQFRHSSPYVPTTPAVAEFLAAPGPSELSVMAWIDHLGDRIANEFSFEAGVTTVATPIAEVLRSRRGVCQDFSHLFIACARQVGLAAAYVSGYILTEPPPGKPRLRGADAMHAWVAIYLPGHGWVEYDPTNHCYVGEHHIVVARGRDYGDVSPIRGVFNGGGTYPLLIGVTVEPIETEAPPTD